MSSEVIALPPLSGTTVCTYGELAQDEVVILRRPLVVSGQVSGMVVSRPGGTAANVARAVANHEVPARFVGHCGTDPTGDRLINSLWEDHVEVKAIRRGRTSSALALQLANSEAALVFDPGDRASVGPDDIPPSAWDNVAVLHVSSFNLYDAGTRPALMRVVERAKNQHIPVSVEVSTTNQLMDFGLDSYAEFLREVEPVVLMCNGPEGDVLGLPDRFPPGVQFVLQHRGVNSTLVHGPDGQLAEVEVSAISDAWDFVGAGDAFAGGFLSGWMKGLDLVASVELAHETARNHLRRINSK